jgi:hypothetical protein
VGEGGEREGKEVKGAEDEGKENTVLTKRKAIVGCCMATAVSRR